MPRYLIQFIAFIIFSSLASTAAAQCIEDRGTNDGPLAEATQCFLGARAASLGAIQPEILDRRTAQSGLLQATQGAAGDTAGFSGPLWVSLGVRYSEFDQADLDLGLATIGSDLVASPNGIFGIMVQTDLSNQDGTNGNSFDSAGYMAGVYFIRPGDTLTFDGRLMAGQSQTDVSGGGNQADDVDGTRWLAAMRVTGERYLENESLLIPHLGVSWLEDRLDGYTLGLDTVDETTVSYGQANLGTTWLIPITVNETAGSIVLGASGIWGFGDAAGKEVPDDLRGRLDLGVEFFRTDAWAASGRIYGDGLGHDEYEALGVDLGITLWF